MQVGLRVPIRAFVPTERNGDAVRPEGRFLEIFFSALSAGSLRSLRLRFFLVFLISWVALSVGSSFSQSAKGTVRHHTVEEQDPSAALLTEAELAISKQDYAQAEALLKKYLNAHPDSYSAWYDLGFVSHALGRRDDAI